MADRQLNGVKRKLFQSPQDAENQSPNSNPPRKRIDLIDEGLFYLPQEVLDTSRGQILVEFMKEWEKKKPSQRRPIFDLDKARNDTVEIDEERLEKLKQTRKVDPGAGTSKAAAAAPAADINTSPVRRQPLIAPSLPKSTTTKKNDLRRSVLRSRNDNKFTDVVASTPCDANLHPLNYSSVSPISNVTNTNAVSNRLSHGIRVLNNLVLNPSKENNANEATDSTPPGIIPTNQTAKPKNLSKMIANGAVQEDKEDGLIARRNENFDHFTSDESNDVVENNNQEPPLPQTFKQSLAPLRESSSSSSSVSSLLLDGFCESILPRNPIALSPQSQPLLEKALRDRAIQSKSSTIVQNNKKSSTFVVPVTTKVPKGKKSTAQNPQVDSYFELSEVQERKKPQRNGKKKSELGKTTTEEYSKRKLFSQRFDDSSSDVESQQPVHIPATQPEPDEPSFVPPPAEFANNSHSQTVQSPGRKSRSSRRATRQSENAVPDVEEQDENVNPLPTKRSSKGKKKSAAVATEDEPVQPQSGGRKSAAIQVSASTSNTPSRRSNGVQTSAIIFEDEGSPTPGPSHNQRNRTKRGGKRLADVTNKEKTANPTIAKPRTKKRPVLSPSAIIESSEIAEGGVRKSKRTKYLRTDGHELIVADRINYREPHAPAPKGCKGYKQRPEKKASDADKQTTRAPRKRKPRTKKPHDDVIVEEHDLELESEAAPAPALDQQHDVPMMRKPRGRSRKRVVAVEDPIAEEGSETSPSKRVSIKNKADPFKKPLPPPTPSSSTSNNIQQTKTCKTAKVVVEKIPSSLMQGLMAENHSSDSGLISGMSHEMNEPVEQQRRQSQDTHQETPATTAETDNNHDEQLINAANLRRSDQSEPSVNLSLRSNASNLEQWTTKLLNASAYEKGELEIAGNVFEREFDQLANSDDVEFISHCGVDFATYKGEHFKNSGYMRIHPRVTKARSRAKKFDLRFLVVSGGPVEVLVGNDRLQAKDGSQVVVVKGQRYEMTNHNDHVALLFFYKT